MSDFLYTVLWITVYSIPSFLIQLLLCFKVKSRFIRHIPIYISVAGIVFSVDMFFNFSGLHHGWHELGAFFIGCYVGIFALGVAVAWLVYRVYIKRKSKKR